MAVGAPFRKVSDPKLGSLYADAIIESMKKSIHSREYDALISWLKAARKRQGLSQRDLAKKMRVQQSFIAKIELKERRLDVVEFVRICKALGVDPAGGIRKVGGRTKI